MPENTHTPDLTIARGTRGVTKMNDELATRSRGSVSFVGMWHTHPGGAPDPSPTDQDAMARLFAGAEFQGHSFLMLIVGGSSKSPLTAVHVFDRNE